MYRKTYAIVDLGLLKQNLHSLKNYLKQKGQGCEVLAMVKANAYGHGLIPCAKALEEAGCNFLGVVLIEEAQELLAAGIKTRVLVMGASYGNPENSLPTDFDYLVYSKQSLKQVLSSKKPLRLHLKVDTGMSRLGLNLDEVSDAVKEIKASKHRLCGLATHMVFDETRPQKILSQKELFYGGIKNMGISEEVLIHVDNSSALMSLEKGSPANTGLCRPGILLYGYRPGDLKDEELKVEPILSLKAEVIQIKEIAKGTTVSYGGDWCAEKKTRLATIALGYGDGFPRALSNKGAVLFKGQTCPIRGKVCMDFFMVDITDLVNPPREGDQVVILGKSEANKIDAWDIAKLCDTIPYEVLCQLTGRIARNYKC